MRYSLSKICINESDKKSHDTQSHEKDSKFKIQVDYSNLPHMPKAYDRQICIRHMIADNNNKNKRMWVIDKRIDNI